MEILCWNENYWKTTGAGRGVEGLVECAISNCGGSWLPSLKAQGCSLPAPHHSGHGAQRVLTGAGTAFLENSGTVAGTQSVDVGQSCAYVVWRCTIPHQKEANKRESTERRRRKDGEVDSPPSKEPNMGLNPRTPGITT
ncbi:uncharacterized protein LOC144300439 [Canis aureus]